MRPLSVASIDCDYVVVQNVTLIDWLIDRDAKNHDDDDDDDDDDEDDDDDDGVMVLWM